MSIIGSNWLIILFRPPLFITDSFQVILLITEGEGLKSLIVIFNFFLHLVSVSFLLTTLRICY